MKFAAATGVLGVADAADTGCAADLDVGGGVAEQDAPVGWLVKNGEGALDDRRVRLHQLGLARDAAEAADGWHGRVTVGVKDDGSPDRRHVRGRTEAVVIKKVRDLERNRDAGTVPLAGRGWTVAGWLEHWLEHIARPSIRPSSWDAYRIAVRKHLVPAVGGQRLDRLTSEHLERLYRRMIEAGSSPGTAHQVHRTARTVPGEAVRRHYVQRNVAELTKGPRVEQGLVEPYSLDEV